MYRISAPNFLILSIVIVVGIILTSATPNYFGSTRILSFISLIIGELGMSFIPIIALYPKANPSQSIILAFIFFISTFIMCVASWGVNSLGWPGDFAFQWKDNEFYVNTYSLFVANIVSLASLVINFKLIYDEELTKNFHNGKKGRPAFRGFKKPLLKRPDPGSTTSFSQRTSSSSGGSTSTSFSNKQKRESDDDFGKPFDFTPDEAEVRADKLPEESSGKLFVAESEIRVEEKTYKPNNEGLDSGDVFGNSPFFQDEELRVSNFDEEEEKVEFSAKSGSPSGGKLAQTEEKIEKPKPINIESSIKLPSDAKKDLAAIFEQYSSLNAVKKLTTGISEKHKLSRERKLSKKVIFEDVHEATFRPLSQAEEQIEEIKESLKKESREELIESIKDELKEELRESFKNEMKQNLPIVESEEVDEDDADNADNFDIKNTLENVNKVKSVLGSFLLDDKGNVLVEEWNGNSFNLDNVKLAILHLFKKFKNETSNINQGQLNHLLLETDQGTLVLAAKGNKVLCIHSEGTGEVFSGQILRTLSELEDSGE
jgi:predicted regulator of Ras-like GTPase activity (Roadblock/LC7/MglB family)